LCALRWTRKGILIVLLTGEGENFLNRRRKVRRTRGPSTALSSALRTITSLRMTTITRITNGAVHSVALASLTGTGSATGQMALTNATAYTIPMMENPATRFTCATAPTSRASAICSDVPAK